MGVWPPTLQNLLPALLESLIPQQPQCHRWVGVFPGSVRAVPLRYPVHLSLEAHVTSSPPPTPAPQLVPPFRRVEPTGQEETGKMFTHSFVPSADIY